MSLKGIVLGGDVIDSDFRGNMSVILKNTSYKAVEIDAGGRIAQVFFLRKRTLNLRRLRN